MTKINLKIGYWNINKKTDKEIGQYILSLIAEKKLDLLFLSEFQGLTNSFYDSLFKAKFRRIGPGPNCQKIIAFQRELLDFKLVNDEKRFMVAGSNALDLSIVGLHLEDNTNDNQASWDRNDELKRVLESLKESKKERKMILGDFNCMPNDPEMLNKDGLHAIPFKKEILNAVQSSEKEVFYNPILLALNEENQMYGSFRYVANKRTLYWYAYDQVVVNSHLMDWICNIEYPKAIGGQSLMSSMGINPKISDHLPLVFDVVEAKE